MNGMILAITITLLSAFFLTPSANAKDVTQNPCLEALRSDQDIQLCEKYVYEVDHNSQLNVETVNACFEKFYDNPKLKRSCLESASRHANQTSEKISSCANNFYWSWSIEQCMESSPVLSQLEIQQCADNSKWLLQSILCFRSKAKPQPALAFLQ